MCDAARVALLGGKADCAQELVAETPAGRLYTVRDRGDAFGHRAFVIVTASGAAQSNWSASFLDIKALLAGASAEAQARICASLDERVVRCLPGDPQPLPDGVACAPPRFVGDKLEAIVEQFHFGTDHYTFTAKWDPYINRETWKRGACDESSGLGLAPDTHGPWPRTAWLAPPPPYLRSERAPAPLADRICDATRAHLGPDIRCEAWRFPDLETSQGTIYFASTDAGRGDVLVRARPDGTLVGGAGSEIAKDMWTPLSADARAGKLAPDRLLALRLLVAGWQVRVSDAAIVPSPKGGLTIEATLDDDFGRPHAELPGDTTAHDRERIQLDDDGGVSMGSL